MLGFADAGVTAAFLFSIATAALCVVYGFVHWNDDDAPMPGPVHPRGERVDIDEV